MRHPPPDIALGTDPWIGPDQPGYVTLGGSFVIDVLGSADSQEVLDEILTGWQSHVDEPNGLQWALDRLHEAAEGPEDSQIDV